MPERTDPPKLHEQFRAELDAELDRRDLARWIATHRDEFAALLAQGDMDWAKAARHFAQAGMLLNGVRPDAAATEAAWRRISRRRR